MTTIHRKDVPAEMSLAYLARQVAALSKKRLAMQTAHLSTEWVHSGDNNYWYVADYMPLAVHKPPYDDAYYVVTILNDTPLSGPFETLDAAKTALMLMVNNKHD
jgi:hypothetical protein